MATVKIIEFHFACWSMGDGGGERGSVRLRTHVFSSPSPSPPLTDCHAFPHIPVFFATFYNVFLLWFLLENWLDEWGGILHIVSWAREEIVHLMGANPKNAHSGTVS